MNPNKTPGGNKEKIEQLKNQVVEKTKGHSANLEIIDSASKTKESITNKKPAYENSEEYNKS